MTAKECAEFLKGKALSYTDGETSREVLSEAIRALEEIDEAKAERDRLKACRHKCDIVCLLERFNEVCKERDEAAKIINDARTYLEDLGSPRYALMQLRKWESAESGGADDEYQKM